MLVGFVANIKNIVIVNKNLNETASELYSIESTDDELQIVQNIYLSIVKKTR